MAVYGSVKVFPGVRVGTRLRLGRPPGGWPTLFMVAFIIAATIQYWFVVIPAIVVVFAALLGPPKVRTAFLRGMDAQMQRHRDAQARRARR